VLFQSLIGLILTVKRGENMTEKQIFQSLIGLILTLARFQDRSDQLSFQSLIGLILTLEGELPDKIERLISIPHRSYFNQG